MPVSIRQIGRKIDRQKGRKNYRQIDRKIDRDREKKVGQRGREVY